MQIDDMLWKYMFGSIKSYEIPYLAGLNWLNIHKSQQWHGVKGARWTDPNQNLFGDWCGSTPCYHCWRVRCHWTVHDKLQLWVLSIWLVLSKRHEVTLLQRKLHRPYYLPLSLKGLQTSTCWFLLTLAEACFGFSNSKHYCTLAKYFNQCLASDWFQPGAASQFYPR